MAGSYALAVAVALGALVGCSVGDQLCTPESNLGDKSDDCPYGPPGGPKPPVGDCPDVQQLSALQCAAPKTWVGDVFPIFATIDANTGACGIATCHGGKDSYSRVFLPPDNPKMSFDALTAYEGSQKYPYVNATNPEHSWILCNLEDPPGVGQVMPSPPGALSTGQIDTIRQWVSCGLQYEDGGGVGGGGAGGAGGGGAGGAGGG